MYEYKHPINTANHTYIRVKVSAILFYLLVFLATILIHTMERVTI